MIQDKIDNEDAVDTTGPFNVIDWPATVTASQSCGDCFEVGFLQTVTKNRVVATYAGASSASGRCEVLLGVPIRDGFADSPVWFQSINSRGAGFNILGVCTVVPSSYSPFGPLTVSTSTASFSMTDRPGGVFRFRHPKDSGQLLRRIEEDLSFSLWVAVRRRGAPEGDAASYTFLRNAVWVLQRTTELKHYPSGNVGIVFLKNETAVTSIGDGRGSSTPILSPPRANTSTTRNCTP